MRYQFNSPEHKERRRELRGEMPEAERKVWQLLRGRQLNGYKFRRQHGIGPYIVDFYCSETKLFIEIDGDSHYQPTAIAYDQERDAYLRSCGMTILRFTNLDVQLNLDTVAERILEHLKNSDTSTNPS